MKIPSGQSPSQAERSKNAARARKGLKLLRDDKIAQAAEVLKCLMDHKKESSKELDGYLDKLAAWQKQTKDLMQS